MFSDKPDPRALTGLGDLYNYGHGVPKKYKTALYYYKSAAALGDADAQVRLDKLERQIAKQKSASQLKKTKVLVLGNSDENQRQDTNLEKLLNQSACGWNSKPKNRKPTVWNMFSIRWSSNDRKGQHLNYHQLPRDLKHRVNLREIIQFASPNTHSFEISEDNYTRMIKCAGPIAKLGTAICDQIYSRKVYKFDGRNYRYSLGGCRIGVIDLQSDLARWYDVAGDMKRAEKLYKSALAQVNNLKPPRTKNAIDTVVSRKLTKERKQNLINALTELKQRMSVAEQKSKNPTKGKDKGQLSKWYQMYMLVKECNQISSAYISRSDLKTAKRAIKSIEDGYKRDNKSLNTDAIWNSATIAFDKDMGRSIKMMKMAGAYQQQMRGTCKLTLMSLDGAASASSSGEGKSTRKKDF